MKSAVTFAAMCLMTAFLVLAMTACGLFPDRSYVDVASTGSGLHIDGIGDAAFWVGVDEDEVESCLAEPWCEISDEIRPAALDDGEYELCISKATRGRHKFAVWLAQGDTRVPAVSMIGQEWYGKVRVSIAGATMVEVDTHDDDPWSMVFIPKSSTPVGGCPSKR